jgi:predicted Zn-dependent protease
MMARAAAALGENGESHEQLALYHYEVGELDAAVRQLEIALRVPVLDFYDRSRLESLLKPMKQAAHDLRKVNRR